MKNTSGQVTASVSVAEGQTADGIIIAQGSRFGGWALYVEDGHPTYTYNNLGDLVTVKSRQKLSAGDSEIRLEIYYDGGGIGKGADLRLIVNDGAVATGRLETTIASRFSIDEGTDIGMDRGAPVIKRQLNDRRYSEINASINKVTLEVYPEA